MATLDTLPGFLSKDGLIKTRLHFGRAVSSTKELMTYVLKKKRLPEPSSGTKKNRPVVPRTLQGKC